MNDLMLFTETDDSAELTSFAVEAGWVKINPNELFLSQYQDTLKKENPNRPTKPGFIRPSSLTECVRKLVFEYLAVEEESHYEGTPRIGESGSDAHTRIQNYIIAMKEHGYDVEYLAIKDYLAQFPREDLEIIDETKGHIVISTDIEKNEIVYKEVIEETDGTSKIKERKKSLTWYMERYKGPETLLLNKRTHSRFKADGIVKFKGEYYILEIKTENSRKYTSHVKTLEPHEKHKLQGTFYGMSFGIDKVMFLYENRDSCATFITVFDITQQAIDKVEKIIADVLKYGENGWVAPRTVSKDECKFCPYQARCDAYGNTLAR